MKKKKLIIPTNRPEMKDFVKNILHPIDHLHGDDLPVSKFVDRADGVYPQGSAAFEKRGIAITVPEWDGTKCAQCNLCSMVCPHAVIRPVCLNEEEVKNAPEGTQLVKHKKTDYSMLSLFLLLTVQVAAHVQMFALPSHLQ